MGYVNDGLAYLNGSTFYANDGRFELGGIKVQNGKKNSTQRVKEK
jgi:hypothetical protein